MFSRGFGQDSIDGSGGVGHIVFDATVALQDVYVDGGALKLNVPIESRTQDGFTIVRKDRRRVRFLR